MAIEKLAMRDNGARYPNQRAVKIMLDASHTEKAENGRYVCLVWDLNTAVMKDLNRYAAYVLWQYFCHIGDKNYEAGMIDENTYNERMAALAEEAQKAAGAVDSNLSA